MLKLGLFDVEHVQIHVLSEAVKPGTKPRNARRQKITARALSRRNRLDNLSAPTKSQTWTLSATIAMTD
jgi:hypothetical protein